MRLQKIIACVFLFFGVFSLVFATYELSKSYSFKKTAIHTFGDVQRFESHKGKNGVLLFVPIVTFIDGNGDSITFVSKEFHRSPRYQIGEKVEIIYDGKNSSFAKINDFESVWGSPLFIGGIGLLMVIVGIYAFFRKGSLNPFERTR